MNFKIIEAFKEDNFALVHCEELNAECVCNIEGNNIKNVYLITPDEFILFKNNKKEFILFAKKTVDSKSKERLVSNAENNSQNVVETVKFIEYRNKVFDKYFKVETKETIDSMLLAKSLLIACFAPTENVFINSEGSALMFEDEKSAFPIVDDYNDHEIKIELREFNKELLNSKEKKSLFFEIYNLGITTILYTNKNLEQKTIRLTDLFDNENYSSLKPYDDYGNPLLDFAILNTWQTIGLQEMNAITEKQADKGIKYWVNAMNYLVYDAKLMVPFFENNGNASFYICEDNNKNKFLPSYTSWSSYTFSDENAKVSKIDYENLMNIMEETDFAGLVINPGSKCSYKLLKSQLVAIKSLTEHRKNMRMKEAEADEYGFVSKLKSGELELGYHKGTKEYMIKYPVILPSEHFEYSVISENEFEEAMVSTSKLIKLYKAKIINKD